MDAILFYGERDEATRRQVRSAAAQHSHRIGPRKPKASQRPRADSGISRRRNLQKAAATMTVAAHTPPGSAGKLTPTTKVVPSSARPLPTTTTTTMSTSPLSALAATHGPPPTDPKGARKRPAAVEDWEHQVPPFLRTPSSSSSQLSPTHSASTTGVCSPLPTLPPLFIARIDRTREERCKFSHLNSKPQSDEQSQTLRLPQYSWTEYPRYCLGHNSTVSRAPLQILAHRETGNGPALSPPSIGNPNWPIIT